MNLKDLEVKKRHHHVWASYLSRWGNGTNKVHYTTKNGKLAHDSVRGIVVDDYFYKTTPLSKENIEIIKFISKSSPDYMQKIHMQFLDNFLAIQRVVRLYRKLDLDIEEANQIFEAMKCNMLENLHSQHETGIKPILASIANGKTDIFNNSKSIMELLIFIGHQFARTKTLRESAIKIANESNPDDIMSQTMVHAWWFISYMLGMNIGSSLYGRLNTSSHTILTNRSETPSITADQPVLNVHPCVNENEFSPPKMVDFYYPISPQVAFIACESKRFH